MTYSLVNALRVFLQLGTKAPSPHSALVYSTLTQLALRGQRRSTATDAEDVAHEVYLTLLRGGRVFEGTSDAQARVFLQTALLRERIDGLRRVKRGAQLAAQSLALPYPGNDMAPPRSLCALLEHLATLAANAPPKLRVLNAVEKLDELGLLPWTDRGRLDDEALAAALGINKEALHTRRRRLRERLLQIVAAAALAPEDRRTLELLLSP